MAIDPTRSLTLRRQALGIVRKEVNSILRSAQSWASTSYGVGGRRAQRSALRSLLDREIAGAQGRLSVPLRGVVRRAYAKGVRHAIEGIPLGELTDPNFQGGRNRFINLLMNRPGAAEQLEGMVEQATDELADILAVVKSEIRQELDAALTAGENSASLRRRMKARVNSIINRRVKALTNVTVVRTHAEAQLDALEALGVTHVTAQVEFVTAGDARVCPTCRALNGKIYTIAEARGVIPVHVNCRCSWRRVVKRRKSRARR